MRSEILENVAEEVLISDILPQKYNFRDLLRDRYDIVLSISSHGLVEPIVIRPRRLGVSMVPKCKITRSASFVKCVAAEKCEQFGYRLMIMMSYSA